MTEKPLQSCIACWQPNYKFDANWTHLPFICDKCRTSFTPIQMAQLYESWRTRKSVEGLTAAILKLLDEAKHAATEPDRPEQEWWEKGGEEP